MTILFVGFMCWPVLCYLPIFSAASKTQVFNCHSCGQTFHFKTGGASPELVARCNQRIKFVAVVWLCFLALVLVGGALGPHEAHPNPEQSYSTP